MAIDFKKKSEELARLRESKVKLGGYTAMEWKDMIFDGVVGDVNPEVKKFIKDVEQGNLPKVDQEENKNKTEAKIQSECFIWFNNTYPHLRGLLYHVPNGEKRDPITANKLKAMGVVAGIPDLVFHYRARTYFFEFKKDENEKPSKDQERIHKALDLQRFIVWVVWNKETFEYLIDSIISDTSEQFTLGVDKNSYYYKHKIFDYLYSLTPSQVVEVDTICEPENKQKFVNYISEFITEGYGRFEGFEILFTPDYKGFYKKLDE